MSRFPSPNLVKRVMMAALVVAAASLSMAQPCALEWSDQFAGTKLDDRVYTLAVLDDGSGPMMYAGGAFGTAGRYLTNHVAAWDGRRWYPYGAPGFEDLDGFVRAITVFDDGGGPAVYAGGRFYDADGEWFYAVMRWDGSQWSIVGEEMPGHVHSLVVFDDGTGPALYTGARVGPLKWDGTAWEPIFDDFEARVTAMTVFDDGDGTALFIGGYFDLNGTGEWDYSIIRWDGADVQRVGGVMNGRIDTLVVHDDGSGGALYVGGNFTEIDGVGARGIACLSGTQWQPLGDGVGDDDGYAGVSALASFDDGGGLVLYAGGGFTTAGDVEAHGIARWDGTSWSAAGAVPSDGVTVRALAVFDDGSGPRLYAGGEFEPYDGYAPRTFYHYLAVWDGSAWSWLGNGLECPVRALATYDDGDDEALYLAAGYAIIADERSAIVRWDGTGWSVPGNGIDGGVRALTVYDDGSGAALYASCEYWSGSPARLAKWDGFEWSVVDSEITTPPGGTLRALTTYDDGTGSRLIAAGGFSDIGGVPASHIAQWDGVAWAALGEGLGGPDPSTVNALAVLDDGSAPALYAGGWFTEAGGVGANCVAKWDGVSWSPLGTGVGGDVGPDARVHVRALAVYDDGSGPALYVGGIFTEADGVAVRHLAQWDGTGWTDVGGGVGGADYSLVNALAVFDDASGPALYVSGWFFEAGGVSAHRIARWDGVSWSALETGIDGIVDAMTPFDDGHGPGLYLGGNFAQAGEEASAYIARWGCPIVIGDLDGDGDVDLADLTLLLAAYRRCEGDADYNPLADLDRSGCIDLSDLAELLGNYGAGG